MQEWYEWSTLEEFNAWHEVKKTELGLPKPGTNQDTGLIDPTAVWTTDYTSVTQVEGKWIALVEQKHSAGLSTSSLRPPLPDFLK